MSLVAIRKTQLSIETILHERGPAAATPLRVGTALAVVVTAVAVRRVTAALPAHVAAPGGRAALEAGLEAVTTSLRTMLWLLAGLGLLVGGAGFLFGRSDAAAALRARVVAVGGRAGRVPVAGGGRVAAAVAGHADGARLAVLGVAALVLFVGGLTWASVVVVGVVVAAGLALVELARRRTPAPMTA